MFESDLLEHFVNANHCGRASGCISNCEIVIFLDFIILLFVMVSSSSLFLWPSHIDLVQAPKEQMDMVIDSNSCEQVCLPLSGSDYCLQRPWRTVVLEHMYQSLSDDECGIQGCIRDALAYHPHVDQVLKVKVCAVDSHLFSQDGWLNNL